MTDTQSTQGHALSPAEVGHWALDAQSGGLGMPYFNSALSKGKPQIQYVLMSWFYFREGQHENIEERKKDFTG